MIRRMKRQAKRRLHQPWSHRRVEASVRRAVHEAVKAVYVEFVHREVERARTMERIIGARFSPDVWAL